MCDLELALAINLEDEILVKRFLLRVFLSSVNFLLGSHHVFGVDELRLLEAGLDVLDQVKEEWLTRNKTINDHVLNKCVNTQVLGILLAPVTKDALSKLKLLLSRKTVTQQQTFLQRQTLASSKLYTAAPNC